MYGACGPHAIVRSVRSFLVLVSLGLLVLADFGCGEPEAPKGSPAARDGVDRTQQYLLPQPRGLLKAGEKVSYTLAFRVF